MADDGCKWIKVYTKGGGNQICTLEDKKTLEDLGIRHLKYEKCSFDAISPLIQAIAGRELGLRRSANVTAYFLTFEGSHTMLNLYDDRDVELLSDNEVYVEQISREFNQYRLQDGCWLDYEVENRRISKPSTRFF